MPIVVEDWAGEVIRVEVGTRSFLARLVDMNDREHDREARFRLDQVPDACRRDFGPGQTFRWRVVAADVSESRRDLTSSIVFTPRQRLTEDEKKLAERRTDELLALLDDADRRSAG